MSGFKHQVVNKIQKVWFQMY